MLRRAPLFVPANNEKMVKKSTEIMCDSVVFDLEDAVPPQEKSSARRMLTDFLNRLNWGKRELCVRINPLDSLEGYNDVIWVSREEKIRTVVVPKAQSGVGAVHRATNKALIAIIETAIGLLQAEDIAREDGVEALNYGAGDFAFSVKGSIEEYSTNRHARTQVAIVAKAYGIDALDKVFFKLNDLDAFRSDAITAKALGYDGKFVIHPTQVEIANAVFSPSTEEVSWSQKVVQAYENAIRSNIGAIRLEGQLVDAVNYKVAKDVLERKRQIEELYR